MSFDQAALERHIPYYLTDEDKRTLRKELDSISAGSTDYTLCSYRDDFDDTMLQGDGWSNFSAYSFRKKSEIPIKALILSNSCDVDRSNKRDDPPRVTYAPLAKMSSYVDMLRKSGVDEEAVKAKVASIKKQEVTSIFYIPKGGKIEIDLVVRFDHAFSAPLGVLCENGIEKLFTLSPTGFYLLALKLSVHFCRLHEHVQR